MNDRAIRELFSGFGWSTLGKGLSLPLGIGIPVLLTRLLPPDQVGSYFVLFATVKLSGLFSSLGLRRAVVRMGAQRGAEREFGEQAEFIGASLLIGGGASCLVAAGVFLGGEYLLGDVLFPDVTLGESLPALAIWIVASSILTLTAESHRSLSDIRLATLFEEGTATRFVIAISLLCLWLLEIEVTYGFVVWLSSGITALAAAAGLISLFRGALDHPPSVPGWNTVRELMVVAWPMWLTSGSYFMNKKGDTWLLGILVPSRYVALYEVADRLARVANAPLRIVNAVNPPFFSRYSTTSSMSELRTTARVSATLATIPAILIVLGFVLVGESIIEVLYGVEYTEAYPLLLVLAGGRLAQAATGSSGLLLMMTDGQRLLLRITVFSGLVTFLAALFLTDVYGTVGMAIAVAGGVTLQNLLAVGVGRLHCGIWSVPILARPGTIIERTRDMVRDLTEI